VFRTILHFGQNSLLPFLSGTPLVSDKNLAYFAVSDKNLVHLNSLDPIGLRLSGKNCIYRNFCLFFPSGSDRLVLHQFLRVNTTVFNEDFLHLFTTRILPVNEDFLRHSYTIFVPRFNYYSSTVNEDFLRYSYAIFLPRFN